MSKITVAEQSVDPPNPAAGQHTLFADVNGFRGIGPNGAAVSFVHTEIASAIGGELEVISDAGSALASGTATLTEFYARRGAPGTGGMTTLQLELNGVVVPGSSLAWTSADIAWALKSISGISAPVVKGDRISLRITTVETGEPEDIIAGARS